MLRNIDNTSAANIITLIENLFRQKVTKVILGLSDNSNIKVSVIVPVYKVERYLSACLDSLLAQSMQEIEVLLIDDGSPDQCGKICDEYASRDSRFRVFHTDNRGLSAARNSGIEKARGDYLMFVDSDDWVSPSFCQAAYNAAIENAADLVLFRFRIMRSNGRRYKMPHIHAIQGIKTQEEAIDLLLRGIGSMSWNKLYRKELFKNIKYPEGQLFEDVVTTYKLVYETQRIYYLDRILYYFRKREGSITRPMTVAKQRNAFAMIIAQYKGLKEHGYPESHLKAFLQSRAISYCVRMGSNKSDKYSILAKHIIDNIEGIPSELDWKQRVLLLFYHAHPRLFDLICLVFHKRIQ